jgi:uncharacterized protein YbjQ (UPF0145 family)
VHVHPSEVVLISHGEATLRIVEPDSHGVCVREIQDRIRSLTGGGARKHLRPVERVLDIARHRVHERAELVVADSPVAVRVRRSSELKRVDSLQ